MLIRCFDYLLCMYNTTSESQIKMSGVANCFLPILSNLFIPRLCDQTHLRIYGCGRFLALYAEIIPLGKDAVEDGKYSVH